MKKIFTLTFLMGFLIFFASCAGCSSKKEDVKKDVEITLENIPSMISTDRQTMYLQMQEDYRWFESQVQFKNFYDEESTDEVYSVVNIFQAVVEKDSGADVTVYAFTHLADTTTVYSEMGFWLEDSPLNEETIKLSWKDAYERMMATNHPKPHSKQACLRKPVGPQDCNAQYVFGNIQSQLWVDAVTGDVKNSNPAFPEGLEMPLGEWP